MSSVSVDAPSIIFVKVWFRTHGPSGRRLPKALQSFWFMVIDEKNHITTAPLPAEIKEGSRTYDEAVVAVAAKFGCSICSEVVRTGWPDTVATWALGNEEFCNDAY
jgi:hypothetical protein